nr:MAG TPA: hypothetical protein [Caudoviricetes sp.]
MISMLILYGLMEMVKKEVLSTCLMMIHLKLGSW